MADSSKSARVEEQIDSTTTQAGLGPIKSRAAVHASDRRLLLELHDVGATATSDVLSLHTTFQDAITTTFSLTVGELEEALKTLGIKFDGLKIEE